MGCTSAIVFTCFGAAYGTAKAGVGISAMGVLRPDLIVKSMSNLRSCVQLSACQRGSANELVRLTDCRYHSRHHGWYYCHLRSGCVGSDLQ